MFDASKVECPKGWRYMGITTPCFGVDKYHEWYHNEGFEGRLGVKRSNNGDNRIAIVYHEELVGLSTVLP